MPDSPDTNPRQSMRSKKNIQSTSTEDGTAVKGKERGTARASQGQRKVGSIKKEVDIFDVPQDKLEDKRPVKDWKIYGCRWALRKGERTIGRTCVW